MQVLDNKMTKIVLVVAVAAVLAFLVKTNEKALKLNNDMSMLVMGLIVVVALYAIFLVNSEEDMESFQANPDNETLTESDASTTVDPSELNTGEVEVNNAENTVEEQPANNAPEEPAPQEPSVVPAEPLGENEEPKGVQDMYNTSNAVPDQCYPKDVLTSADLLPKDTDSTWAQSVPATNGALSDQNFLNAGYHIGVNTVGQSLRNANRQLRSDPPCPRRQVSPWMQSTIEADTNRRPLEMGSA